MTARPAAAPQTDRLTLPRGVHKGFHEGHAYLFATTADGRLLYGIHQPAAIEECVCMARLRDVLNREDPVPSERPVLELVSGGYSASVAACADAPPPPDGAFPPLPRGRAALALATQRLAGLLHPIALR